MTTHRRRPMPFLLLPRWENSSLLLRFNGKASTLSSGGCNLSAGPSQTFWSLQFADTTKYWLNRSQWPLTKIELIHFWINVCAKFPLRCFRDTAFTKTGQMDGCLDNSRTRRLGAVGSVDTCEALTWILPSSWAGPSSASLRMYRPMLYSVPPRRLKPKPLGLLSNSTVRQPYTT